LALCLPRQAVVTSGRGIARIEHDLTKYRILQVTPELRQGVVRHSKQQHRAELGQRSFLADLEKMKKQAVSYFEIYRTALGSGSPALAGRARVDKRVTGSDLYQVARDIATRAGIEQGLILAPQHEGERANASADASMISVTQAAELIGITRAAVYKAVQKGALPRTTSVM
jgi:hypothetical protein